MSISASNFEESKAGFHNGNICSISISSQTLRIKPRVVLNQQTAVQIYQLKIDIQKKNIGHVPRKSWTVDSIRVSNSFDVSPKTIRDIWNRRTWQQSTQVLWPQENSEDLEHQTLPKMLVSAPLNSTNFKLYRRISWF